ncbi:MAG: bifunctional lysylphosphatidylglycerol flippase/synthetase MprF [Ktedonobacterales bacterium]
MVTSARRPARSSQAFPLPPAPLVRAVPALLMAAVAVATLISLDLRLELAQDASFDTITGLQLRLLGRAGELVVIVLLLLIARALAKGKRQAWLLTLGVVALACVEAYLTHRHGLLFIMQPVAFCGLLALGPLFSARSDRRMSLRGYGAGMLSIALIVAYALLGRIAFAHRPADLVFDTLRGASLVVLAYAVVALLRPVLAGRHARGGERGEAARVIAAHGGQAVAHFALGADKSYFWSASRRSLIAYRVACGVALALGDPVGPMEESDEIVRDFLTYCRRQDWAVAWYQATAETRFLFRGAGLYAYKIGEEAVVDLGAFTMHGKVGERVRHAISRARRGGVTVQIWQGDAIPDAIFAGMKRVSVVWMGGHGTSSQMGFSMGRFPAEWSPDLLTAVALSAEGEVQAFTTWTPLYAGNGWALDAMRRLPEATPGAMELLLAECFAWARERCCVRMSLGLVPLAGLCEGAACDGEEAVSPSLVERGAAYLQRRKLLLGNYAALARFKDQFQPEWQPRYLVVADRTALPNVLRALAYVHSYTSLNILKEAALALRPKKATGSNAEHAA